MDSHEKLGSLLSQYIASQSEKSPLPPDVKLALEGLGLTEYVSLENLETTYREKLDEIQRDMNASSVSRYSREYAEQQKSDLDSAYALVKTWISSKA